MPFYSILFPSKEKEISNNDKMPDCLSNLNLDQFFGFIFEEKIHFEFMLILKLGIKGLYI